MEGDLARERNSRLAVLKTQKNDASVTAFLNGVDEKRRDDCLALLDLMQETIDTEPAMWESSIVGFGKYHYTYASGQEGD